MRNGRSRLSKIYSVKIADCTVQLSVYQSHYIHTDLHVRRVQCHTYLWISQPSHNISPMPYPPPCWLFLFQFYKLVCVFCSLLQACGAQSTALLESERLWKSKINVVLTGSRHYSMSASRSV